jgi:hypothetical protein
VAWDSVAGVVVASTAMSGGRSGRRWQMREQAVVAAMCACGGREENEEGRRDGRGGTGAASVSCGTRDGWRQPGQHRRLPCEERGIEEESRVRRGHKRVREIESGREPGRLALGRLDQMDQLGQDKGPVRPCTHRNGSNTI